MAFVAVRDDAIWVTHIEGDAALREMLARMPAGKIVNLEVAGVVGSWEKMRTGKDGRPTSGLKPVGPTRAFWKSMQAQRGESVEIHKAVEADTYLAALRPLMTEWDSPEDEEAYCDL